MEYLKVSSKTEDKQVIAIGILAVLGLGIYLGGFLVFYFYAWGMVLKQKIEKELGYGNFEKFAAQYVKEYDERSREHVFFSLLWPQLVFEKDIILHR